MVKTASTEFQSIQLWFTDQNNTPFEIEGYYWIDFIKMRYSAEPKYAATKTRINVAKAASKREVQKTAEATGDLIGNKIADKITSLDKTESRENEDERQEIYIQPVKRQQIIDDLRLF